MITNALKQAEILKATKDQIAKVMLLHGTPAQVREALEYCGIKPLKPTTSEDIREKASP
jgi:hypothetical protein